jgi:hypothetical protein
MYFALAAFLWLPASAHCELETVPGFEFLHCASGLPTTGSADAACDDCDCCAVEKSHYRTSHTGLTAPTSELIPEFFAHQQWVLPALPADVRPGILTFAAVPLLPSRHFLGRTALPVRAPSFVS